MQNKYNIIFIDAKERSDKIRCAFNNQGHLTEKIREVTNASSYINMLENEFKSIIIWHLSSSFYNRKKLIIQNVPSAIKAFDGANIFAKYAVSDTSGYRIKAIETGFFCSKNYPDVNLVFAWDGLKQHFNK
ncbi:MAG: hypothetical protein ACE5EA_05385 [Nitrospirota bacterium]